jgi:hypothetical protein
MGKVIKARLNTLQDARRLMARVINEVNAGTMEEGRGRCIGYLVSILSSCIKDSEFEARLKAIEEKTEVSKR